MEPWYGWWHGMGFMGIVPVIFLIVGLVFMFTFMSRGPGWFGRNPGREDRRESAREILDRRFANGEIDKQQYEDMKRALAG